MEVEENVFFCRQVSELKEGVGGEEFHSSGGFHLCLLAEGSLAIWTQRSSSKHEPNSEPTICFCESFYLSD